MKESATMRQAVDLRAEGDEFRGFLETLEEGDWARSTPFKNWTVNDVVSHLHLGDWMTVLTLKDPERFLEIRKIREDARESGGTGLDGIGPEALRGRDLLQQWDGYFQEACDLLDETDPRHRVKWYGPDMGVRMVATARQMETWAHGQDIYDLLKHPREATDRIRNIAEIGVRTFGWTFANRGLDAPGDCPHVRLTAPSGDIWEWHEPDAENQVAGSAVEFCHVVTQGRNIADVNLTVIGEPARQWMAIAQCFAGPANDPPEPGARLAN